MPGKEAPTDRPRRKPRRYSTNRLMREPVTIQTPHGPVVVGAEIDNGRERVTVIAPEANGGACDCFQTKH